MGIAKVDVTKTSKLMPKIGRFSQAKILFIFEKLKLMLS